MRIRISFICGIILEFGKKFYNLLGFSALIETDGQVKLREFIGTTNYVPPEILRRIPYDGKKSDIFSLGVILFALLFSKFGFQIAIPTNDLYKLIVKKKYGKYWEKLEKK